MLRPVLASMLVLSLLAPGVHAAPLCAAGADAPVYVHSGPGAREIWQESNGAPGLQRAACEDAAGRAVAPDTLVASVPNVPVPQDLCVTVPVLVLRVCLL